MIRHSLRVVCFLLVLLAPAMVFAASINIKWSANSEKDLAYYNVYYGTSSRAYGNPVRVGKSTQYEIKGLKNGRTYYVAITAVDSSGNESGYSSEIKTVAKKK